MTGACLHPEFRQSSASLATCESCGKVVCSKDAVVFKLHKPFPIQEKIMRFTEVESSNLSAVAYDGIDTLHVRFKSGDLYEYKGVTPELYGNFAATFDSEESTGSFLNLNIKNLPYTKISVHAAPRQVLDHKIHDGLEHIDVWAMDKPGTGNANHKYKINVYLPADAPESVQNSKHYLNVPQYSLEINFQHGPIKEVGANGILSSALIAVLLDVHRGFASGDFKTRYNSLMITSLEEALNWNGTRSRERRYRGVEGTNQK
jgi:hypothetical protein